MGPVDPPWNLPGPSLASCRRARCLGLSSIFGHAVVMHLYSADEAHDELLKIGCLQAPRTVHLPGLRHEGGEVDSLGGTAHPQAAHDEVLSVNVASITDV